MEKKPQRRTRERILETALSLFNESGESEVTTAAIAAAMNISPGNLYYHFRSKDQIVAALFSRFRAEIERTLLAPESRPAHAEDVWLFLHLVFEAIYRYRFLYRDINAVVARHPGLEAQFKRVLAHKQQTALAILRSLVATGQMNASPAEVETLAVNMTVLTTYWLSYELARDSHGDAGRALARGAFHVISLAAPYLAPAERALFDDLAERYLG